MFLVLFLLVCAQKDLCNLYVLLVFIFLFFVGWIVEMEKHSQKTDKFTFSAKIFKTRIDR